MSAAPARAAFHAGSRVIQFHPASCGCAGCGRPFGRENVGNQVTRRWMSTEAEQKKEGEAAKEEAKAESEQAEKEELITMAKHQEALKLKDAQIAEFKDRLIRQVAETENVRKRSEIERENATKYGTTKLAKSLLDVADNLELSLKAVEPYYQTVAEVAEPEEGAKNFKTLYEGLQLVNRVLEKAFEKSEIRKFESLGKPFDPNFHDGVFQFDDPTQEPHTVGNIMKEGYTIYERVLRPASVGTVRPRQ